MSDAHGNAGNGNLGMKVGSDSSLRREDGFFSSIRRIKLPIFFESIVRNPNFFDRIISVLVYIINYYCVLHHYGNPKTYSVFIRLYSVFTGQITGCCEKIARVARVLHIMHRFLHRHPVKEYSVSSAF